MKRIFCLGIFWSLCLIMQAQSYNRLVEQAMEYTRKDSLKQAEQLFRQALKVDASNARNALVFSNLGTILKRQGRVDEAVDAYTMALNITPYATSILLNRAALYLDRNLLDKAYVDYCNVIDLIPENREARLFRAYINMQRRQYDEARMDYNTVLLKDAKNQTARLGMILLDQKEGRLLAARDGLNQLIEEAPQDVSLLKMRANLELEQGYPDAALVSVDEAIEKAPEDADAYVMKGDIYLLLKKKKEARNAYERAVELGISRVEVMDKLRECK